MAAAGRIASFLASGTEIVAALGLEERLVGISHECDYPPSVLDRARLSRPRFDPAGLSSGGIDAAVRQAMLEHGSVYQVDEEALRRARPDLVLAQAVCDVCAVSTAGVCELVERAGIGARVLSLDAHTVDGILETVLEVGEAAGVLPTATSLIGALRARLAAVEDRIRGAARPRVLAIEWLDPPFAPGHWVPEMIERAGGVNLVGEPGAPSRQLTWAELAGHDPDVLVIMPCGYGLERSLEEAGRFAAELREVAPRALGEGRAWAVDGSSYFNRSGPRVVRGVEILAAVLHPDRFPPPDPAAARAWPLSTA